MSSEATPERKSSASDSPLHPAVRGVFEGHSKPLSSAFPDFTDPLSDPVSSVVGGRSEHEANENNSSTQGETQACVASVVSAYGDAGALLEYIRVRHAEKRAPHPSIELAVTITSAQEKIESAKQRNITQFGKAFEDGDSIAVTALQEVIVQLQSKLLVELGEAIYNDKIVDFTSHVYAADLAQISTISILDELRKRLLQNAPIGTPAASSPHPSAHTQWSKGALQLRTNGRPGKDRIFLSDARDARQDGLKDFSDPTVGNRSLSEFSPKASRKSEETAQKVSSPSIKRQIVFGGIDDVRALLDPAKYFNGLSDLESRAIEMCDIEHCVRNYGIISAAFELDGLHGSFRPSYSC